MARTKAGGNPPAAVAWATGAEAHSGWMGASWILLLSSLFTPLLTDSPGWFGLKHSTFWSGLYLLQSYAAQILVVAALACFAVALWRRQSGLRWHPALAIVLGLLGWTLVSTALSPSPASAVLGITANSQGLQLRIVATAVLLMMVGHVDSSARIRVVTRVIGVVGGITAFVGILQAVGINPLGYTAAWGVGRSFGTLGNPDMFGDFIVFALFASLGAALSEKKLPWRVVMLTANALCAAAAVTSYSRAAWFAVLIGTAAFAVLAFKSLLRFDRRLALATITVLLVVAAFVAIRPAAPGSGTDVADRLRTAVSLSDPDSAARLEMWDTAFRAVALRPLQGYGPDTMVLASEPIRSARYSQIVQPGTVMESAHNIPVQTLSDLGIPGFALWTAMLAAVAVVSLRTIISGPKEAQPSRLLLAGLWAACVAFLADSLFTPSSVAGTLFLFCALGLLLSPSAGQVILAAPASRRSLALGLGVLSAVGGIVAALFLGADMQAAIADNATAPGAARMEAAALAVRLNPLSADYAAIDGWATIGQVETLGRSGGDPAVVREYLARAVAAARRAVAIEPTNQRRRSFLASVLHSSARYVDPGLEEQALAEWDRAMAMSPNDLKTRYDYSQALDPEHARPVLESVLREHPTYVDAVFSLSELDLQAGDFAGARNVLRAALAASPTPEEREQLQPRLAVIP